VSNQRLDFEQIPEIKEILKSGKYNYSESLSSYVFRDALVALANVPSTTRKLGFLNGAWFYHQLQNK
jgi:hypothetical protein